MAHCQGCASQTWLLAETPKWHASSTSQKADADAKVDVKSPDKLGRQMVCSCGMLPWQLKSCCLNHAQRVPSASCFLSKALEQSGPCNSRLSNMACERIKVETTKAASQRVQGSGAFTSGGCCQGAVSTGPWLLLLLQERHPADILHSHLCCGKRASSAATA